MGESFQLDVTNRDALLRGVERLAKTVKGTLGPRGSHVIIEREFGSPTITRDGAIIANEIVLADPYENMGAQLTREIASKTSDVAGGGATTATVLAEAIYKKALLKITEG